MKLAPLVHAAAPFTVKQLMQACGRQLHRDG